MKYFKTMTARTIDKLWERIPKKKAVTISNLHWSWQNPDWIHSREGYLWIKPYEHLDFKNTWYRRANKLIKWCK